MRADLSTLRNRLHDTDPAAGTLAYSEDRQAEIVARTLADASHAAPAAGRRRLSRRSVRAALAAALTVATAGAGAAVLLPDSAVATKMRQLAEDGPLPPQSHEYLFTERRTTSITGTSWKPGVRDRAWDTVVIRRWDGDTCNDRQDADNYPLRFLSKEDEEGARAGTPGGDWERVTHHWKQSSRGKEMYGLDTVPCTRAGDFMHPNPKYLATYPSDADGFLAKVTEDSESWRGDSEEPPSVADAVLLMLQVPYLTAAQRSAALQAFGKAAGEWKVTGHATVAGIRGVVIRRDLGPVDEEQVISAQAPGVLRVRSWITDPAHATDFDPRWAGLARGTVVTEDVLLKVAVVPDLDTLP
jgi:hypothetical protein